MTVRDAKARRIAGGLVWLALVSAMGCSPPPVEVESVAVQRSAVTAPVFVQGNNAVPQSPQSSVTVTFTGAQAAGDLAVVVAGWNDGTSQVTSVTDSRGNAYQLAVGPTRRSTQFSQSIYYAKNIVASAAGNAVTVRFNRAVSFPDVRIVEYRNIDAANPVDVTAASTGTASPTSSGSLTTTNANDLLVAANTVLTHTLGPGSGFTSRMITEPDGNIVEDRVVTAVGSYSASAPLSSAGAWVMQMVAFRAAGGDTQAPTAPSGLTATATSISQINLAWTASTDNIGVTGYRVERCAGAGCSSFAQIGTPASITFADTGLAAQTSYSYRVRATDAAGNLSAFSGVATAATLGDLQAPCGSGSQCGSGFCVGGICCDSACTGNPCMACNVAGSMGRCAPQPSGTGCNDGDACTQTDACQAGACVGSSPVTCSAQDQCHVAGTCDPATGACSNPPAANGTGCNDGNACTRSDACLDGACLGADPVTCLPVDQCHVAGVCDPTNGTCSTPAVFDGAACNDGSACTGLDRCQAGVCVGAQPVVCLAQGQCRAPGACNPATGACSDPPAADGIACNDGDACTQADACQAGICAGTIADSDQDGVPNCRDNCPTTANPGQEDANGNGTGDACESTPLPVRPATLALGYSHSCVVGEGGRVFCWGDGSYGQLGNGAGPSSSPLPTMVAGLTGAIGVAAGYAHSCALLATGELQCWGYAGLGVLADGSTPPFMVPVPVAGVDDAVDIAAGFSHTCAVRATGGVVCWGWNAYGQLGTGDTADALTPTPVIGLDDAVAITAGSGHTCALRADGHVACWGYNFDGELGDGGSTDSLAPVPVVGVVDAVAVSAGLYHTCAVLASGQVACWGANYLGALGDGTTTGALTPVAVSGLTDATGVASGSYHACARRRAGQLACWGAGYSGQLGNGETSMQSLVPSAVLGVADAASVAAGGDHSCAARAGGEILCWGAGSSGQLGNGTFSGSSTPVAVAPFTGADLCHFPDGPPVPDGSPCNDGNACTQVDTCQAGTCVGSSPVMCDGFTCQTGATCDPFSGLCFGLPVPDGTPCNDGNACTQVDTCWAGSCTGSVPVVCPAPAPCYAGGTCNPASGLCPSVPQHDGTACSDGNACTQVDTCQAGACVGSSPVVCGALDVCHLPGTCNPTSGACTNPPKPPIIGPGALACGGACVDITGDLSNCGACGAACGAEETCAGGMCRSGPSRWPTLGGDIHHSGFNPLEQGTPPLTESWRQPLSGSGPGLWPAVHDGSTVYVTEKANSFVPKRLWALASEDGHALWNHDFGSPFSIGQATVDNGHVYVAQCNNYEGTFMYSFLASTGGTLWSQPFGAQWERFWAPLVVGTQLFFNGGTYGGLYSLSTDTGSQLFFNNSLEQFDEWSPLALGTKIYTFVRGKLRAHDRQFGWIQSTASATWNFVGYDMLTSPVSDGAAIYAIAPPNLYAFHPDPVGVDWTAPGAYSGMPAVANGVVYAISGGQLRANDAATGSLLWTFAGDGALSYPPAVAGRWVYVASTANVYAVDTTTRQIDWSGAPGGWLSIAAGALYVAQANGTLSAYALTPP